MNTNSCQYTNFLPIHNKSTTKIHIKRELKTKGKVTPYANT